jgi:hypothetical protein
MGVIRDAARQPVEVDLTRRSTGNLPSTVKVCEVCGIGTRFLSLAGDGGAYIHAEPRTLANNLHNGTPDHNAVVTR